MGSSVDPQRADQTVINLFHPIYHSYTYPIGCRTDIERILPASLEEEDTEELIDNFSEPPVWVERFSPLAVQVGDQIIRAKNAPDLMLKIYRMMFDLFAGIGRFIETTMAQNTGEAVRYPFMSLCVDPDTLHRLIEFDYESGETTYANLMKMFGQGTVAPCITMPFHAVLPMLENDAEIRLCVRSGLIFYLRILKVYSDFLERNGESGLMVVSAWLPECGYSRRVVEILEEEFQALCKKEKLGSAHLVLLLDNHQARFNENDILMKSWNQLHRAAPAHPNGRRGRDKHDDNPALHQTSLMFRDRSFSDWVIHANPSVKKLLDRTIAKVDSDINTQNVHYGWAHFEELEAITYTPRAIVNFQQKLIKLTELGYLPLSPDFFVRGKLRGEFGCTTHEPQSLTLEERSIGNGWDLNNSADFSRWTGVSPAPAETSEPTPPAPPRTYERITPEGKTSLEAQPCWKLGWDEARRRCHQAVIGNLETLQGGMAEVLGGLTGHSDPEKARRNVNDFLANYTYVYWREHFIQHDLAEADINIEELASKYLRAGIKGGIEPTEAAKAGAAAQAIFLAIEASRSFGPAWENMDQRAFYQNVVMMTLAICNTMYVYHWCEDDKTARHMLGVLKSELLEFESAFERYDLASHGMTREQWQACLKSEVEDSTDNVVRRAALRTAARHLRPLGYAKEFTRQDANITTNVGHLWSYETCRENFCYENTHFCGLDEQ